MSKTTTKDTEYVKSYLVKFKEDREKWAMRANDLASQYFVVVGRLEECINTHLEWLEMNEDLLVDSGGVDITEQVNQEQEWSETFHDKYPYLSKLSLASSTNYADI